MKQAYLDKCGNRVSVKQAASLLGVSEQYIRLGLQRGELPIGSCVKLSTKWTYHISPFLLQQYAGLKMPPVAATTDGEPLTMSAERT